MLGAADEQRAALLRLSCATCSNCLRNEQVETREEYEKTQSQLLRANFHASKCFPTQKRRKIDAVSIRECGESKKKREKWLRHEETPEMRRRTNECETFGKMPRISTWLDAKFLSRQFATRANSKSSRGNSNDNFIFVSSVSL